MGDMDRKVAVITGAGSGMGKACAQLFVDEGARVVAADNSGQEEETAEELGESVLPFHCVVSQEEDVIAMFEATTREFGRGRRRPECGRHRRWSTSVDVGPEHYEKIMSVDLRGVFWGTKHAILNMRTPGAGSIVNRSSSTAFVDSWAYASV
jgi:NAD(P)-dependent dehydrogenase (short-subunit alcohol dehydrogenase family)